MPETVKWSSGRKDDFRDFIATEITQTQGDRGQLERKWIDHISQHRARVFGDGTTDAPFIGSSDLEFPLTSIHAEPIYWDLKQTLHTPRNFWNVVPLRPDTVEMAAPWQEFLNVVERNFLKMGAINKTALLDLVVLGTTVYKDRIKHKAVTRQQYNEAGETEDVRTIDFEPEVRHIALQDFVIPAYADHIDPDRVGGAPWVAHRFDLTESQLRERAEGQEPFLPNYDPAETKQVLKWALDVHDDAIKEERRREDEYQPFHDEKITLHEVWARFDIDKDGIDEDIVVVWHQPSMRILRATHNPHQHEKRPFSSEQYMPGFGFYGVGVAEADEWAQIAMTRMLNNALDNVTLANMRMFSAPYGSDIQPDEPLYAGKVWLHGQGERPVQPVQMGEVYPSMFQMMGLMQQWSELRTGSSDVRQGDLSTLPSRTPASTVLSMLQESNKRFDGVLSNMREGALADIGQRVSQNLMQISRDDPRWIAMATQILGPKDGGKVAQLLRGDPRQIEDMLGINVTATSSQVNKEAHKQSFITLMQLASQVYPQLVQYATATAQATGNQELLSDTIGASYRGFVELMKRLLETFDIQNPDQYLPAAALQESRQEQPLEQPPTNGAGGPETAPLGGRAGPGPFQGAEDPLSQLLGL